MIYVLLAAGLAAAIYQLLALAAALRHLRSKDPEAHVFPPVSILKPVCGLDPHFYQAIRSHAVLDYPDYEIIFGVRDPADPAIAEIERLKLEFPARRIRLVMSSDSQALNRKVGGLIDLAAEARNPVLVVNDGDVRVPPDYLRRVVAPLEDKRVGLVTCLYGVRADTWPARWEALGVVTDFPAGVLVARLLGQAEFGLGSTLAFRAAQLRQFGGFEALADYLADDYQLGRHISQLGYRVALSRVVVETNLSGASWSEVWRHQVRWARTIRLSRGGGYLGLPVTNAALWFVLLAAARLWWLAVPLLALRLAGGLLIGVGILRSREAARYFFLIPARDLWALAIWAAGLSGSTVEWRGARLKLDDQGKIIAIEGG